MASAGRSFKPASFLTRPGFTRTSSGGSVKSMNSEDSFTGTLRSLALEGGGSGKMSPALPDDKENTSTPRKNSAPITIELPKRDTHAITPLSARGDLPGGYFPNHDHDPKPRRPSGFSTYSIADLARKNHAPLDTPSAMSATSSPAATPALPSPLVPAPLMVPMGKYHPNNYVSPVNTTASTRPGTAGSNTPIPPLNLTAPKLRKQRPKLHQRQTSEVRQKLEKYQKDMVAQAKIAAGRYRSGLGTKEPESPKLTPMVLASPGIMTPLELGTTYGENGERGDFLSEGERHGRARKEIKEVEEREREREREDEEMVVGGESLMLG